MLLLGHVGITFGVALAAESLRQPAVATSAAQRPGLLAHFRRTLASLSTRIDVRLLLIGSMLPDIIDKPVGLLLFPSLLGNGRIFAHTLAFPLILAAAGMLLYRTRRSTSLLVLAYGTAMHLILDAMWRLPTVLFWPFMGPMPRGTESAGYLARLLNTLLTNPAAFVPEMVGAILVAPLLWIVLCGVGPWRFMRSGHVD